MLDTLKFYSDLILCSEHNGDNMHESQFFTLGQTNVVKLVASQPALAAQDTEEHPKKQRHSGTALGPGQRGWIHCTNFAAHRRFVQHCGVVTSLMPSNVSILLQKQARV